MAFMASARKWLRTKVPTSAPVASFADRLAATVRSEFVLCEPEPSQTVMGFTAVGGGAANTYQLAFTRFHQADVVEGGIYGKVIGVQENDTALTARTSIASVNSNPGSYWWDEANELLYVHSSTGADPDTFTLVQVNVRLYLSNAPITLELTPGSSDTAVCYLPWLTANLPRIRRRREDLLFGSMAVPDGSVSFTNGHQAWFTLVAPDGVWNWKNKPIRFYIGGSYDGVMMTRSQFAAMATMRIEDVAPNEDVCEFALVPLQRFAEINLPVTPFFSSDYPNLGSGVEGTKKWIGYGRTTMRPDLTDTTSHGVYTIADAAFQTLTAVHNAWAIEKATGTWTALVLTTDYTVNLTACTLTVVNATYAHAAYDVAVDVTGLNFTTYADIVEDMLTRFLGATAADLDATAFTAAAAAATNELSVWLKSERSLTSILATAQDKFASLGRSAMGTVQQTVAGTWTASIWNANVDDITTSLLRSDFASFQPKPKLKTIFPTVRVFYNFDHARQSWSVVEKDDARTRYRTGSRERADLYTFLRSESDAQRLAERYQLLAGGITVEAAFQERGAMLAQKEGGGKTFVTYDPAPAVGGAYERQPFEILQLEVSMGPKLAVSGLLGNFHGLGGRIGKWMVTGSPDWSTATASQREVSGFWCYSNGLADLLDPASANQSIWF